MFPRSVGHRCIELVGRKRKVTNGVDKYIALVRDGFYIGVGREWPLLPFPAYRHQVLYCQIFRRR